MISRRRSPGARLSCERITHIDASPDIQLGAEAPSELSFLLRRLQVVRESDPVELQNIINEILTCESYRVRQMVSSRGVMQSGASWVAKHDVDVVTNQALERISKFLRVMDGTSIGQLRNGIKRCVQYAVATYVRDDQRNESIPADPGHFTGALDPEQVEFSELTAMAAVGGADDRALLLERLEAIDELGERAGKVVVLRGLQGHSSKEVATELGISPANVDQIYSRSLRKLRELAP